MYDLIYEFYFVIEFVLITFDVIVFVSTCQEVQIKSSKLIILIEIFFLYKISHF